MYMDVLPVHVCEQYAYLAAEVRRELMIRRNGVMYGWL